MCSVTFLLLLQNREVGDLTSWKSLVSMQLDNILRDNAILRLLSLLPMIVVIWIMLYFVVTCACALQLALNQFMN